MARIVRASPISPMAKEIPAATSRIRINTSVNCLRRIQYHFSLWTASIRLGP